MVQRISMVLPAITLAAVVLFAWPSSTASAQENVQAKLDKRLKHDKPIDAPVKDVLEFLEEQLDLKIKVDKAAFARAKVENVEGLGVKLRKMDQPMGDTILRLMLEPLNAVYEIREKEVVIIPSQVDGQRKTFPPFSDARRRAIKEQRERLTKARDAEIRNPAVCTLRDAIEFLGDFYDVSFIVDGAAFDRELKIDDVEGTQIKLPKMKGSFDKILREALGQVKGTYTFHGDHIRIVPQRKKES